MANWNGLVMTDKGIALQSKVQAGEVLNITKLKLGSGTLPAETDIRKLTDLIKPEQNLGIGGREPNGDYCKISATISNVGLEAGYYVRELGVFAQDPDDGEILYAYTTDGAPDYLPAEGGSTVISQEFSVNIAVSDTDKINVEIDPGALATMGYVQLQINEHNEDASAHEKAFSQHNIDETAHYDMTGATGSKAGKRGFVPAPKAGDQNKALFGNGQFQDIPLPEIASQEEAEAQESQDNKKMMTVLRTYQAIVAYFKKFLAAAVFTGIVRIEDGGKPSANANDNSVPTTSWVQALITNKILNSSTFKTYIVEDYLLEQNGYIKFGSWFGHLILQWGYSQGSEAADITFPIAFGKLYCITQGFGNSGSISGWNWAISSWSARNFHVIGKGGLGLFWVAAGKA